MSFAAMQARLMMLVSMQYDIELQTNFIMQHKMFLQKSAGGFMNMKAEFEPNSKADKVLEARVYQLNEAEKILDNRLQSLSNREKEVTGERDKISQVISQNIERTFKNAYGVNG